MQRIVRETNGVLEIVLVHDNDSLQKAERYGGVKREDLSDDDFVFSDERKFPIKTSQDVKDAVSSWGRYKGSKSFDDFKRRLKAIAKKKGFESALPDTWGEDENEKMLKGGAGSGNFGHSGRIGERGGSGGGSLGGGGGGGSKGTYERAESSNGGTYVAGISQSEASELDGIGFKPNEQGHPTYKSVGPGNTKGRVTIKPTPEGSWELVGKDATGEDIGNEIYDRILDAAEDGALLAEEGAEAFDFEDAMPSGNMKKRRVRKAAR